MQKNNYSPYEELENIIKHHQKFGFLNRMVGDWFNALGIIISTVIPALLLIKKYYSVETQMDFDYYLIIISSLGLIFVLVNNIFKFRQRSELNFQILYGCKELKRNYSSNILDDNKLSEKLNEISKKELIEINGY